VIWLTQNICRQRREHRVFEALLLTIPGLEDRLLNGSESDLVAVAESVSDAIILWLSMYFIFFSTQLQKGISGARSDDTKSIKGPVLDWITPLGQSLNPPLSRNVKADRGFHHERTGLLLCPAGMDWSDVEYAITFLSI